ncbi:MAG: glycosyltransferase [Candidatus Methylomirabilia bacterium]
MSRERIKEYFERIAPVWDYWRTRNSFYHGRMRSLIRGMVPPGAKVLELGSGTGDLLAALKPSYGVGLNVAQRLTDAARDKFPTLDFYTVGVDQVRSPENFCPDYVVLNNMLDYVYDVWDLLESLRSLMSDHTLLIVTTNNPLWAPILRIGSRIGQRSPDSPRNFITNRDIRSVLELQGFDAVEEGLALPVPRRVPVIGAALNAVLPELPVFRYSSSIQYIAARLRASRAPLSCSVVIPCHNEEENIVDCVQGVPPLGTWTEIVVVDDGSTDGTRRRVQEIMRADGRVRLIASDRNQGKADAVRAGFQAARGEAVMILDADMAVMPEDLQKFLKPLQNGTADFVNGTRLVYPMEGRAMKMANFLGNKAFCFLLSWIVRQRVSDTLCGTKAMLRRDYVRMPQRVKERWGDFDLLFGAARLKLRILEIPVHYRERRAGKSKMRVVRDGLLFLRACWHGWRMLRFPDTAPWVEKQEPVSGWREIETGPSAEGFDVRAVASDEEA